MKGQNTYFFRDFNINHIFYITEIDFQRKKKTVYKYLNCKINKI